MDESVAVWQTEARWVDTPAMRLPPAAKDALLLDVFGASA
jgi:hypothetical protein